MQGTNVARGMLEMLETLLSITERFTGELDPDERDAWQNISAKVADLRDGESV